MVNPLICGIINPTDPTFIRHATSWDEFVNAYDGAYSDGQSENNYDQGCKGKQLPGDSNIFYFIAMEYNQQGAPQIPYLVKSIYDPVADSFTLAYKALPSIFGVVNIPKPNQLTVTTGGRVFIPIGSYDIEIAENKLYYFDVTGTLSDDPDDWTITTRFSVSSGTIHATEGTFCMCLSPDETKIVFIGRGKIIGEGDIFLQITHLCDLDGSNPSSYMFYADPVGYKDCPRNIEVIQSGTPTGTYMFIGYDFDSGGWYFWMIKTDGSGTWGTALHEPSRSVASDDGDFVYAIDNMNNCVGSPNTIGVYTPTGTTFVWVDTYTMICPQATPTHLDIYLPTVDTWTASGIKTDNQGSVRRGSLVANDYEEETGYDYGCTAAPRKAV